MTGVDGKRVIDGRPEALKRTVVESLQRLGTDHIDLYYLHRWDKQVPIEESMGALADMVRAGQIGAIGLSEVSATTLRKAHAVHPVAAVQSEYSLWARNAEVAVLEACRELGVAYVAFSPVGRGFLAQPLGGPDSYVKGDIRQHMPRFMAEHWDRNAVLYARYAALAAEAGCTPAQLALVWLLEQAPHVLPIPGTSSIEHLEEDIAAASLKVDPALLAAAGEMMHDRHVGGARYAAQMLSEVDTEVVPD
jgi:aryl-alcohol dehydrogenase-like predicted oxidoreductase